MKASETLIAAETLAAAGDFTKASDAYATVAKEAPSGYVKMAKLAQASAMLANGQRDEAIAIYKALAADGGPIGDVALIRAGWALSATAPRSEVETLLAPLTDPTSPWRFMAREILAYADFHAGNVKAAQLAIRRARRRHRRPGHSFAAAPPAWPISSKRAASPISAPCRRQRLRPSCPEPWQPPLHRRPRNEQKKSESGRDCRDHGGVRGRLRRQPDVQHGERLVLWRSAQVQNCAASASR